MYKRWWQFYVKPRVDFSVYYKFAVLHITQKCSMTFNTGWTFTYNVV